MIEFLLDSPQYIILILLCVILSFIFYYRLFFKNYAHGIFTLFLFGIFGSYFLAFGIVYPFEAYKKTRAENNIAILKTLSKKETERFIERLSTVEKKEIVERMEEMELDNKIVEIYHK